MPLLKLEPTCIEPCLLEDILAALSDLIAELAQSSAVLGARLHPFSAASLAELVRVLRYGGWRSFGASKHDVAVGRHVPPSSARVEDFMNYFAQRYRFERLGKASRVVAMAAAHHRLNYIHPFVDGNGRVSRLMSHAMALQAGIGAHGLWSISRGLARGLTDPANTNA